MLLNKKRNEELKDFNLAVMDYVYRNEKKSFNRNSLLRPRVTTQSFEGLLNLSKSIFVKDTFNLNKKETLSFLDELCGKDELGGGKAIIVVPSEYSEGNLYFGNARAFLEDAQYIAGNDCSVEEREKLITEQKKNCFSHKIYDKELTFEIWSDVRNFKKNEWKKVVAVFVQGDDWEFKDWPKSENVISILQKVKGFNLKYKGMPKNENVKRWNVKILEISRAQRHFDVSIQNYFWQILEEFLRLPRYR